MAVYEVTHSGGSDGYERAAVDTDQLLALHGSGLLVAVHGPVETRQELAQDLEWEL
jgi:hypothetical protein